ncbi:MAG TPA: hypothetical protein V6D14_28530 [Coleofasciculaceae cyanobacterium]|jgi:hypothetical protein
MKAIALFQFYFPYVLPRDNDWENQGVAFQFPDILAKVRPRNLEEELFPEDIDKTLSTMQLTLSRLSLPVSSVSRTVKDLCLDRIEVRVEGELESQEDVKTSEVQAKYKQIAVRSCNVFINHCRVVSQSPFIVGVEEHFRFQDERFYIVTPHSISWFEGERGERLPAYEGDVNATATSGAIPSPERGMISMSMIRLNMSLDIEPNLTNSLLLDAKERIITLRIREAILSIGTACEVAANEYLHRKGKFGDTQVKKILKQKVSFAEKRFHLITDLLDGRSLKLEDGAVFDLVEKAYRTRNNVAHEGRAKFDDGGSVIEVDAPLSNKFFDAAERAVNWLSAL